MKRSDYRGSIIVVEGRDDRLFFQQFIDVSSCTIEIARGKQTVCEIIRELQSSQFSGAVGIVDADFDRVEGLDWQNDNLIAFDANDLEAMLIQSSALRRVLVEFGSDQKLRRFGKDIRESLLVAALPIACFRLYSRRSGLDLTFQGITYSSFIDQATLATNIDALIGEVKNRSQRPGLSHIDLAREIQDIEGSVTDPWQMCCGDDLVGVLSLGLRRTLGSHPSTSVTPEVLRRSLRLAYQNENLESSELGNQLRRWEARNPGYRVL